MQEKRSYITFPALTQVLKAEKCLADSGIQFSVVPIPRDISSDCGVCIMCPPDCLEKVLHLLGEKKIEHNGAHTLQKKRFSFF